jgi:hypothetical protein
MSEWSQLGPLLAQRDIDEDRLKASATLPQAPVQGTPVVDPLLIEYWARKAGYRGEPGVHPNLIKGAPGLQLQFIDDSPIKK